MHCAFTCAKTGNMTEPAAYMRKVNLKRTCTSRYRHSRVPPICISACSACTRAGTSLFVPSPEDAFLHPSTAAVASQTHHRAQRHSHTLKTRSGPPPWPLRPNQSMKDFFYITSRSCILLSVFTPFTILIFRVIHFLNNAMRI